MWTAHDRVGTSGCFGNRTTPRSGSSLPSVDGSERPTPRIGRHANVDLIVLTVLSNEQEMHVTEVMQTLRQTLLLH